MSHDARAGQAVRSRKSCPAAPRDLGEGDSRTRASCVTDCSHQPGVDVGRALLAVKRIRVFVEGERSVAAASAAPQAISDLHHDAGLAPFHVCVQCTANIASWPQAMARRLERHHIPPRLTPCWMLPPKDPWVCWGTPLCLRVASS